MLQSTWSLLTWTLHCASKPKTLHQGQRGRAMMHFLLINGSTRTALWKKSANCPACACLGRRFKTGSDLLCTNSRAGPTATATRCKTRFRYLTCRHRGLYAQGCLSCSTLAATDFIAAQTCAATFDLAALQMDTVRQSPAELASTLQPTQIWVLDYQTWQR